MLGVGWRWRSGHSRSLIRRSRLDENRRASSTLSLIAGGVAVGAGAAFIAGELMTRLGPDTDSVACANGAGYLVNLIDLLKYGLTGVTLFLLVSLLRDQLRRVGRVVGRVAGAGFVVAGVANGIEHCAHIDSLGLLYVFGLLIGVATTAVFGVFVARSRAVPAWLGWTITLGVLAFFVSAEQGGPAVIGLIWIIVGVRLFTLPSATHPID